MRRKKLLKKAKKASVKVKRQAKMAGLSVAETLKQLPKQFRQELAALKKQTKQLNAALNKASKQQHRASVVLAKKSAKGQAVTGAKKAHDKISQAIANLTKQLATVNNATAFLSEKHAGFIALSKPLAKKPANKPRKATSSAKTPKKLQQSFMPVTATDGKINATIPNDSATITATPELEVEFNS